ncbi:MAG: hypothetical protein IJZ39_03345 [Oscillospiraceae bacterium]|nr:hypothetical protein [Oscillospiraceae bacterium]
MYFVTVNGKEYITAHDKTLITFLRDELNLTGTKDAAGADWVLVDGKKTSARAVRLRELKDRAVMTVEGIPENELAQIAAHLAGPAALSGGFFAPGMAVMSKEKNHWHEARPASKQIMDMVSGVKKFADDINVPRQVYVRPIFAKNPGARIVSIDMTRALENVRFGDCILKADIPGSFDGMVGVGDTVENTNQVVALVVTTYLAEMDVLCRLMDIEYDAVTEYHERGVPEMPECATVLYSDDDTLTVYTNGRDEKKIRASCAAALNIPEEQIAVVATPVAGAKSGRAEVFAALVAWLTQQSAKVKF